MYKNNDYFFVRYFMISFYLLLNCLENNIFYIISLIFTYHFNNL